MKAVLVLAVLAFVIVRGIIAALKATKKTSRTIIFSKEKLKGTPFTMTVEGTLMDKSEIPKAPPPSRRRNGDTIKYVRETLKRYGESCWGARWSTSNDIRVCPNCAKWNDKVLPMVEAMK